MNNPIVSVVMPAYNMEAYLEESINSILNQSYRNFEFIIIDDGSTDRTPEILKRLTDPRIKLIFNEKNEGNYPARNKGCRLAKGRYIAVMDADDIAYANRLEVQVKYMEEHPEIFASGSAYKLSENNLIVTESTKWDEIRFVLFKTFCMLHPTMILRKDILEKVGFYHETSRYAEDYDLVLRLARIGKVINIPDVLLMRRIHPAQISSAYKIEQSVFAYKIQLRYQHDMGLFYPPVDKVFFLSQLALYIRSITTYVHTGGLYYGRLGLILFFYHYASYSNNIEYVKLADQMLIDVMSGLYADIPIEIDSGLCGLGFFLCYLISKGFVEGEIDDVLSEVDKMIVAKTDLEMSDWSFESGILGVIYYVAYRYNSGTDSCNHIFNIKYRINLLNIIEKLEAHSDWICPNPSMLQRCKDALNGSTFTMDWFDFWHKAVFALPISPSIGRWNYGLYNGCAGYGLSVMLNMDI